MTYSYTALSCFQPPESYRYPYDQPPLCPSSPSSFSYHCPRSNRFYHPVLHADRSPHPTFRLDYSWTLTSPPTLARISYTFPNSPLSILSLALLPSSAHLSAFLLPRYPASPSCLRRPASAVLPRYPTGLPFRLPFRFSYLCHPLPTTADPPSSLLILLFLLFLNATFASSTNHHQPLPTHFHLFSLSPRFFPFLRSDNLVDRDGDDRNFFRIAKSTHLRVAATRH